MTRDDIIRMAREAGGLPDPMIFVGAYERFATLVAAHEREMCADILDRNADRCDPHSIVYEVLASNAAAIRARSNT